jgi:hypothetical protein
VRPCDTLGVKWDCITIPRFLEHWQCEPQIPHARPWHSRGSQLLVPEPSQTILKAVSGLVRVWIRQGCTNTFAHLYFVLWRLIFLGPNYGKCQSVAEIAVSNPAGAWMSVSCECCVLSGRGLYVGLITRPGSPPECGVSECDCEASIMRRPWSTRGCCTIGGEYGTCFTSPFWRLPFWSGFNIFGKFVYLRNKKKFEVHGSD